MHGANSSKIMYKIILGSSFRDLFILISFEKKKKKNIYIYIEIRLLKSLKVVQWAILDFFV